MSEAIKISVIVPVFNAGSRLDTCVEAILAQTLKEIEIIFVNDGSSDNSLAILESFRQKDSRIEIITQENRGAGAARNRGLDYAKGKYLSFLDADDYFEPAMLAKAYKRCERKKADLCIYKFDYTDMQDSFLYVRGYDKKLLPRKSVFNTSDVKENVFNVTNPAVWNKLFSRDLVMGNDIRFQEISSVNDMFFTYKALTDAKRIAVLPDILIHYREGDESAISTNREKDWHCIYHALNAIKEEVVDRKPQVAKDFTNLVIREILYLLSKINDVEIFRQCLGEIQGSWIEKLIESDPDESSFYDPAMYERYQAMMSADVNQAVPASVL